MEKISIKKKYLLYTISIVLFLDPIRAYTNLAFLGNIGVLKEFIILVIILFLYYDKLIKLLTFRKPKLFIIYFLLFGSYICIQLFRNYEFIITIASLKYIFWITSFLLIFKSFNKNELECSLNIIGKLFFVYCILTSFQQVYGFNIRLEGRGGLTANPSILSFIYLIFCFFYLINKKYFYCWIFLLGGILTFTKTFFVALSMSLLFYFIVTRSYLKLRFIFTSLVFAVIITTFIGSSDRLKQYWGTSFRILTLSEKVGENSFNSRTDKFISIFSGNDFNLMIGNGFGTAGYGLVFAQKKLGFTDKLPKYYINAESTYYNQILSIGLIGILFYFTPLIFLFFKNYFRYLHKKNYNSLFTMLFIIIYFVFCFTLNMFEGFITCGLLTLTIILSFKSFEFKEIKFAS